MTKTTTHTHTHFREIQDYITCKNEPSDGDKPRLYKLLFISIQQENKNLLDSYYYIDLYGFLSIFYSL